MRLAEQRPARAPEVAGVGLVRDDLGASGRYSLALAFADGEVAVATDGNLSDGEQQHRTENHAQNEYSDSPHGAMVARWRVLRCQKCRRPLQRARLEPGSAVLASCRRDRLTFVFVATETGLLVMRRAA